MNLIEKINNINYPVHEHNHTRILVPEVLCSLGGPETQNVRQRRPKLALLGTFYRRIRTEVVRNSCG